MTDTNAPEPAEGISPAPGEWNRKIHPYRATFVISDRTPGLYGYRTMSRMFRTEATARAYLDAGKVHGGYDGRRIKQRWLDVVHEHTKFGRPDWEWRKLSRS